MDDIYRRSGADIAYGGNGSNSYTEVGPDALTHCRRVPPPTHDFRGS
jgi:hypothetical protein